MAKVSPSIVYDNQTVPYEIKLQAVGSGEGGKIYVAEQPEILPFSCKRQYVIESGDNSHRGGAHAHKKLWQLFICCRGEFKLFLEGIHGVYEFILTDASVGLVLPPGYWRNYEMAENTVVSVLASETYSEDDYIRDYENFKAYLNSQVGEF